MFAPSQATRDFLRESNRELGELGSTLRKVEISWRDRYDFLAAKGYTLRPRYRPGWQPSWEADPDKNPMHCEDYWFLPLGHLMDATRTGDGRLVCIKRVASHSPELEIATYFSQPHVREDPRNHCIPILDTFVDEGDGNITYMIMPFLRPLDNPAFELVEDVLGLADQMIEGLAFIHEHHVAHRDCAPTNIFMDADALYPRGFHPVFIDKLPDFSGPASHLSRASAPVPVKYYFADFGISLRFPPGEPQKIVGVVGADRDVPELSESIPYDPFKVDIFLLGNLLRKRVYDKYFRVEFLRPFILSMTKKNPEDRPSAEAALRHWTQVRQHISTFQRACRLRGRDEHVVASLVYDVLSIFKVSFILARHFLGWSSDWLTLILG